jgi:hypothetical protein
MGKIYEVIDAKLKDWLGAQHIFFVATAPLSCSGHVNCSPKGTDSFRVLDGRTVAYADFTGSGVETIAHLKENGRILLMFCSFEGAPKVIRMDRAKSSNLGTLSSVLLRHFSPRSLEFGPSSASTSRASRIPVVTAFRYMISANTARSSCGGPSARARRS